MQCQNQNTYTRFSLLLALRRAHHGRVRPATDPVHDDDDGHDGGHVDARPDHEAEHVVVPERGHRPGRHAGALPRYPRRLPAIAAAPDLAASPREGALHPVAGSGGLRVVLVAAETERGGRGRRSSSGSRS
jgi:hypothetical protein|uniref:Uncharacterized protein n=1 Tax=Zea mays TaxID=4577 RepID=A0A804UL57_MAIZE